MTQARLLAVVAVVATLMLSAGAPPMASAQEGATGDDGRNLVRLVQPLWVDLSDVQRVVLEPFSAQWNTWPTAEKRVWLSLADRFPTMSDSAKTRTRSRILEWAALSPEQRRVARANFRLAKQLPRNDRVVQLMRYRQMTPEQRTVLRESGATSNTAARYAGSRTGLAKQAAQPLASPAAGTTSGGR